MTRTRVTHKVPTDGPSADKVYEVRAEITQDDIDGASETVCPMDLALTRVLSGIKVVTGTKWISFETRWGWTYSRVGWDMIDFIKRFDEGKGVEPRPFRVIVVAEVAYHYCVEES